jgi:hypothetical protein
MEITDEMVREAEARFEARLRTTPTAAAAHYDRGRGRVVIRLTNGLEIMFPPRVAEGLAGASAAQLGVIEISPSGLGLHFPRLDADLYLPALLAGVFGSPAWSAAPAAAPPGVAGRRARARPRKAAAE